MKFIPVDKLSKLREAAKSGDVNARKILDMQMGGEDFGSLMDEFFQPKPVVEKQQVEVVGKPHNSKLEEFLKFNNVTKDSPDYESFVEDFYTEFPSERPREGLVENPVEQIEEDKDEECFLDKLINEEIDAINSYNEAIMKIMNLDDESESSRRGMIAKLDEIKRDEMEHLEELKRMKSNLNKKEQVAE